jgi:hypothetical protein
MMIETVEEKQALESKILSILQEKSGSIFKLDESFLEDFKSKALEKVE